MGALIPVLALRLLVPLTIRRWPFWGGIAAMIADTIDSPLLKAFGWPHSNGIEYQSIDKLLDTYYFAIELWTALQFLPSKALRRTFTGVFFYRLAGVILFEITHIRKILFFAPNIFELPYLFVSWARQYRPDIKIDNTRKIILLFGLLAIPKLFTEYTRHFREYPLGVGTVWRAFRTWIGF